MTEIMYVEPNQLIGWTSKYTHSTMLIATKIKMTQYVKDRIESSFDTVWIDNGEYEMFAGSKQLSYGSIIRRQLQIAQLINNMNKQVYFILPDRMFDAEETMRLYYKYINLIKNTITPRHNPDLLYDNIKLVLVLQATNAREIAWLFRNMYLEFRKPEMYAIPKKVRALNNWPEIKAEILARAKPQQLHYLGFTLSDVNDDLLPKIHSIDTKHPIKEALIETCLASNLSNENIDNKYFELPPTYIDDATLKNSIDKHIKKFERMISRGS